MLKAFISQTCSNTNANFAENLWTLRMRFTFICPSIIKIVNSCPTIDLILLCCVAGSEEGNGEERKGCPDRKLLLNYLQRTNLGFSCTICGKQNSQRGNSMNHVESVHFPNLFEYECYVCGKKANNYNSLQVHISTNHRNLKK